jgi:predicted transcriptional regulator of viral defense system
MASLQKNRKMFSPSRGLWIPIPPEYRTWGAPDPMHYIDDMMAHLGVRYVVEWLSAAERHGASHHAAQVFQVATSKTVRARAVGRSRLEFYSRNYVDSATPSTELLRKTGVHVASPGTTMLMLAADPVICGGMSNGANLVIELAEEHPGYAAEVAADAVLFTDAATRRLGWLLDTFGEGAPDELAGHCAALTSKPSFLSPTSARTGKLDPKWRMVMNEELDLDVS